ncbi:MAG: enoyl-CoA hydratase/isomerase family protein [Oligoflexia bacterium]|nr:enoyl-CoA hydratase/isomerase family protein [Oligoflexia bacterium]
MKDQVQSGKVTLTVEAGIGRVRFFHPKSNSLPGALLRSIAEHIDKAAMDPAVKVVVLESEGEGAFCAGASFSELQAIKDLEQGKVFFSGFSQVILSMRRCPKFVIARVQGKCVGGGVGLAAAADYAFAVVGAAAKLSELAVGIGPFVVGPAVERKIGTANFSAMSIDYDWRSAEWCLAAGLYQSVLPSVQELDAAVNTFATKLAASSVDAMSTLKKVLWEGTENWETLLPQRAALSGTLVLTDFARAFLSKSA